MVHYEINRNFNVSKLRNLRKFYSCVLITNNINFFLITYSTTHTIYVKLFSEKLISCQRYVDASYLLEHYVEVSFMALISHLPLCISVHRNFIL